MFVRAALVIRTQIAPRHLVQTQPVKLMSWMEIHLETGVVPPKRLHQAVVAMMDA